MSDAIAKKSVAFTLEGIAVKSSDKGLISLNDIWVGGGRPEKKTPAHYIADGPGQGFVRALAKELKIAREAIINMPWPGEVWGHWKVAIDYAGFISNRVRSAVYDKWKAWHEEQANPGLKIERGIQGYREEGKPDSWIANRVKGIQVRNGFTNVLCNHGVEGDGYPKATDALNIKIHGGTARELRQARGISKDTSLRDSFSEYELIATMFGESLAVRKIQETRAHGNAECVSACRLAGEAVRKAIEHAGLSALSGRSAG